MNDKTPNLRNGSKGGFEPGLSQLRVRHSITELLRSTTLHLLTTKKLLRRVFEQENARLTNMGDLEDVLDGLIGCPDLIVPQSNTSGVHGGRTRSLMSLTSNITDPTILLPGMDLPCGQWSLLNRFRTDAGPCRNNMHEWGYIASPLCDCGEHQTMRHIVNECPLTCFDGDMSHMMRPSTGS